jgi:hypothetical protein
MANVRTRLAALEATTPSAVMRATVRFIWHGPEDDAALAEMERRSEAKGFLLIVRSVNPEAMSAA